MIDRDGAVRQSTIPAAELSSSIVGGYFKALLPRVTRATSHIVVAFDLPSHRMTLERAHLTPAEDAGGVDEILGLLPLAALTGMLAMPLIFNMAFYRILREPFVLWHSALTLSLLLTTLVWSGLSVALFDPPAMTLSWMATLIFGGTIASGLMFTHSLVEPGYMHPFLRRMLPYVAVLAFLLSVLHCNLSVRRPTDPIATLYGGVRTDPWHISFVAGRRAAARQPGSKVPGDRMFADDRGWTDPFSDGCDPFPRQRGRVRMSATSFWSSSSACCWRLIRLRTAASCAVRSISFKRNSPWSRFVKSNSMFIPSLSTHSAVPATRLHRFGSVRHQTRTTRLAHMTHGQNRTEVVIRTCARRAE
ncbi:7TM diverse intracellular signaling domain-containing protein [Erythrobacter sp. SAORIC-644]|uniref:7TM diverse intracellular signaling domain-containing protein n=1 Tax=Erythrobacter sp. SAORIC-644 TaxID=1869314 RepID=UPI0018F8AA86|nr:7TM diverse intracellular signaling domain-containing protein [Erythrobacter sp. SAORIC-644]